MKSLNILGIGRNTVTVMDLAEDCGFAIKSLLHYNDDRTGEYYFGHEIKGSFQYLNDRDSLEGEFFALSMGDLAIRERLYTMIVQKGGTIPALVHPSCVISRRCEIGHGVQIMPGSIVQGDSRIGDNTVITVNSVIAHSATVGANCLISGNVMIGAYSDIGNNTHIGQGATVVSGKVKHVGSHCILGAGSTLLEDMPDYSIYAGCPAKFLRNLNR